MNGKKMSFFKRMISPKATTLDDFIRRAVPHKAVMTEVSVFVDFPPVYLGCDTYTGAVFFHYFTLSLRAKLSLGRVLFYDETVSKGFDELLRGRSERADLAAEAAKTMRRTKEVVEKLQLDLAGTHIIVRDPNGDPRSPEWIIEKCIEFFADPEAMSSCVGKFRAMKDRGEKPSLNSLTQIS